MWHNNVLLTIAIWDYRYNKWYAIQDRGTPYNEEALKFSARTNYNLFGPLKD